MKTEVVEPPDVAFFENKLAFRSGKSTSLSQEQDTIFFSFFFLSRF